MFGHRRSDMIGRLSGGVAYPADLGIATHADGSVPFIAHSVASRHGGLKRTGRQSAEVHIELARRSYAIDAWAVVAANTQHLGPYTIAPKAAVTDGELDLQGLGGRRRRLLRTARRGLHLTSAASWRRSTRSAVIDVPAKWVIAADGIPVARGPFEVSVIEHAFDLWI
ncbi:MAG: hypothetical protein ACE5EV_04565 [Gaiellales bacterium]